MIAYIVEMPEEAIQRKAAAFADFDQRKSYAEFVLRCFSEKERATNQRPWDIQTLTTPGW